MIDSIISSVNKVKKVKNWVEVDNVIKVNFAKPIYFYEDEEINNKIRKYKKIAEVGNDYRSVIIRDMV
jgi:hypothetical protein